MTRPVTCDTDVYKRQELDDLRSKYGLPDGRLYLARADGAVAGCAALRKLDDTRCELKRMYVRPLSLIHI